MSRAIANSWQAGDNIVLSRMDHDANITPWLMAAAERGVTVRWLDFSVESFEFDLADLEDLLDDRTRLVAVCYASNVTGTVNDVAGIARLAHEVGAKVYVDAVQYAPHGAIDVQAIDCDFLVCSAYKFFGPHYGLFWGRRDCLDALTPYKVRASNDDLPWRFVTGTTNREQLSGVHAAIDYIRSLSGYADPDLATPRAELVAGYDVMRGHDEMLTLRLIDGLRSLSGTRILGISDAATVSRRVSTVSFAIEGVASVEFERVAATRGIQVWSGHNYGVEPVSRLGLLASGGGIRVGPVHYNTTEEMDRVVQLVDQMRYIVK
jgi:cysteine desulfurase family protein (TIGR01976 family)